MRRYQAASRLDNRQSRAQLITSVEEVVKEPTKEVGPQAGPQTVFLSSKADIAFYGGSAGGGKTWALLADHLRHVHRPQFGAVVLRRTTPEIRNEGGLWDESTELYPMFGARGYSHSLKWRFPSGATITFSHMEREDDRFKWKGAQIPGLAFDEVSAFTEKQFFYMLSRNRSGVAGIRPYVRGSCNPDPDSWVAEFISWWIDQDTGFAIPERSGVIRWFTRLGDEIVWTESRQEMIDRYGEEVRPKSFTFVRAKLEDNKILMERDPSYLANLHALSRVDRERLLNGNWKIRPAAGNFFQRGWFEVVEVPSVCQQVIRVWDRAATKPSSTNPNPDWTAGVKIGRDEFGMFWVLDVVRFQGRPWEVEERILNTAKWDGRECSIGIFQDPGSAGVTEADYAVRALAGYDVRVLTSSKAKEVRAKPASSQSERHNVKIVKGFWNESFMSELEGFPDGVNDDQVDAFAAALNELALGHERPTNENVVLGESRDKLGAKPIYRPTHDEDEETEME